MANHQILVISDSHGDTSTIRKLLDHYNGKLATVVHLGDMARDLLQFEAKYPALTMVAVAGNSDFVVSLPKQKVLTLGVPISKRVLLMHGHTHNVNFNINRLMYYAAEQQVDACLFGHTHISAMFSHGSVFFMNPGSLSQPRGESKASYGILTIDTIGNITGDIIRV